MNVAKPPELLDAPWVLSANPPSYVHDLAHPVPTTMCAMGLRLAAFEMVFRSLRSSSFSQEKFYQKMAKPEHYGSANLSVDAENIVRLARNRGLHAAWGRVSPDVLAMTNQIACFIDRARVPLIACQRYSDDERHLGHYRVVVGLDDSGVILHDPCPKTGGQAVRWPLTKLHDYWSRTGENVTGGVAIWIAKREIECPLDADLPNHWLNVPN
nr:papain-like cysteine protease family protein [Methyloceanibacter marginalis]